MYESSSGAMRDDRAVFVVQFQEVAVQVAALEVDYPGEPGCAP